MGTPATTEAHCVLDSPEETKAAMAAVERQTLTP